MWWRGDKSSATFASIVLSKVKPTCSLCETRPDFPSSALRAHVRASVQGCCVLARVAGTPERLGRRVVLPDQQPKDLSWTLIGWTDVLPQPIRLQQ